MLTVWCGMLHGWRVNSELRWQLLLDEASGRGWAQLGLSRSVMTLLL